MNSTIKESTSQYLLFFTAMFLIATTLLLLVSVATNSVADYMQLVITRNIFSPDKSDAFFLIKMSLCIFLLRNISVEFKNFTRNMTNNIALSIISSFLLFLAINLSIIAASGILLLTTLAMESPLYAAIILSALIVTLQGLRQLKAIPKDDSRQDKIAAMREQSRIEANEIIKRHWSNEQPQKNINEDNHE